MQAVVKAAFVSLE